MIFFLGGSYISAEDFWNSVRLTVGILVTSLTPPCLLTQFGWTESRWFQTIEASVHLGTLKALEIILCPLWSWSHWLTTKFYHWGLQRAFVLLLYIYMLICSSELNICNILRYFAYTWTNISACLPVIGEQDACISFRARAQSVNTLVMDYYIYSIQNRNSVEI